MTDNYSDIVNDLKEGKEKAFKTIFDLFHRRILGFCINNGQSKEDAEEVVQEVFLKVWMNKSNLNANGNLESYVFSIAKHVIVDKFRELARKKAADEYQTYFLHPTNDTENTVIHRELQEEIQKTIDSMPEIRRLVFQMSRFKGYSNIEIAKELGISVRTVESHISKALKAFKNDLKHYSAMAVSIGIVIGQM